MCSLVHVAFPPTRKLSKYVHPKLRAGSRSGTYFVVCAISFFASQYRHFTAPKAAFLSTETASLKMPTQYYHPVLMLDVHAPLLLLTCACANQHVAQEHPYAARCKVWDRKWQMKCEVLTQFAIYPFPVIGGIDPRELLLPLRVILSFEEAGGGSLQVDTLLELTGISSPVRVSPGSSIPERARFRLTTGKERSYSFVKHAHYTTSIFSSRMHTFTIVDVISASQRGVPSHYHTLRRTSSVKY